MIAADTQVIKDFYGRIVGYIETDAAGNKCVKDFYRRVLGYYDKATNTTKDFYNRIIAKGDVTKEVTIVINKCLQKFYESGIGKKTNIAVDMNPNNMM